MDENANATSSSTSTTTTTTATTGISQDQLSIALLSQKFDMHNDSVLKQLGSIKDILLVEVANVKLQATTDRDNTNIRFTVVDGQIKDLKEKDIKNLRDNLDNIKDDVGDLKEAAAADGAEKTLQSRIHDGLLIVFAAIVGSLATVFGPGILKLFHF